MARNGPNGTSLFILSEPFLTNIITSAKTAPIQNESIIAATPRCQEKSEPIKIPINVSPQPIQRSFERNDNNANGAAQKITLVNTVSSGARNTSSELNRPTIIPVYTTEVGIILCLMSYTEITMSEENTNEYTANSAAKIIVLAKTGIKTYAIAPNTKPVSNSMIGYCTEIFDRHLVHFPPWTKNETTGTNSLPVSTLLQQKHFERPLIIDLPVPIR